MSEFYMNNYIALITQTDIYLLFIAIYLQQLICIICTYH